VRKIAPFPQTNVRRNPLVQSDRNRTQQVQVARTAGSSPGRSDFGGVGAPPHDPTGSAPDSAAAAVERLKTSATVVVARQVTPGRGHPLVPSRTAPRKSPIRLKRWTRRKPTTAPSAPFWGRTRHHQRVRDLPEGDHEPGYTGPGSVLNLRDLQLADARIDKLQHLISDWTSVDDATEADEARKIISMLKGLEEQMDAATPRFCFLPPNVIVPKLDKSKPPPTNEELAELHEEFYKGWTLTIFETLPLPIDIAKQADGKDRYLSFTCDPAGETTDATLQATHNSQKQINLSVDFKAAEVPLRALALACTYQLYRAREWKRYASTFIAFGKCLVEYDEYLKPISLTPATLASIPHLHSRNTERRKWLSDVELIVSVEERTLNSASRR
jgi:hypothetical protein